MGDVSHVTRSGSWKDELASLIDDGIRYANDDPFLSTPSLMDPYLDSKPTHFHFDDHLGSLGSHFDDHLGSTMDSNHAHFGLGAHFDDEHHLGTSMDLDDGHLGTSVDSKQTHFGYDGGLPHPVMDTKRAGFGFEGERRGEGEVEEENLKDQIKGFAAAWGELLLDLSRGFKDIVQQSLVSEDSYLVQKFGPPLAKASKKLRFLNEYLPEDRDPVLAWPVIFIVFILALAVLSVNSAHDTPAPIVKKMVIHPLSASTILLPDGRHMAYHEQGVPADRARYTLVAPHPFLSSRLAGIPGMKASLLEEFGVRLVTYDLPGFGESDPHPSRDLNSSALDMQYLANALGVNDKFWVLGYSSATMHALATLKYIPNNVAGAAFVAPLVNPFGSGMTKEEMSTTWERWEQRRKFMFSVAKRFPRFLSYFYRRSFFSGKHGDIEKWFSLSLGEKDKALIEMPQFEEFWQRDVEESVRQGLMKPFIKEAVLQVSDWGFNLEDLQMRRRCPGEGVLSWLKSFYRQAECELTGFAGPIHIWQGLDDHVVPPSMAQYISRILPGAKLHQLSSEGHFSYFFFCDECHRDMLSTLFGDPLGPLDYTDDTGYTLQSSVNTHGDEETSPADTQLE